MKKKKAKREKKEAQMLIRLEKAMRDEFISACDELDTSASREIRRFIKRFLIRYNNGEIKED